eukprot:COSAG01_NODE_3010_length_6727_cov_4.275951_3_plen_83_part_00
MGTDPWWNCSSIFQLVLVASGIFRVGALRGVAPCLHQLRDDESAAGITPKSWSAHRMPVSPPVILSTALQGCTPRMVGVARR